MFNKVTVNNYDDGGGPSEVHIHRAPTDASVKLLKEMEQEAAKKVLDAVRLESNNLKVTCFFIQNDRWHLDTEIVIRYDLNGEEREYKFQHPPIIDLHKTGFAENIALRRWLGERIAERLAMEIVCSPEVGETATWIERTRR